jgi:site-specific DNA-methyltransferase (adenine-specific)
VAVRLNTVHNEDCIAGLAKLAAGSVDLAFADPPFNIGYDYDVYQDALESERYLEWTRQWTAGVVRALKPTGTFWLAIGDEYAAELKVMLQKEHGLMCRNWVVWYYTFGVHCKYKFSRSHVHLFYMVKDRAAFTFHDDDPDVRVPSARQLVYGDKRANPVGRLPDDTWILGGKEKRANPVGRLPDDTWILRPQDLPEGFRADADTWYFPRVCGTFKERTGWHGCQMPEQLLGRIIRACSDENELVLDPFTGSGTTLATAKKLRRKFLGFELSPQYAEQAQARLASIRPGDPLEGAAEPLRSAPTTADGRRLDSVGGTGSASGTRRRKRGAAAPEPKLPGL